MKFEKIEGYGDRDTVEQATKYTKEMALETSAYATLAASAVMHNTMVNLANAEISRLEEILKAKERHAHMQSDRIASLEDTIEKHRCAILRTAITLSEGVGYKISDDLEEYWSLCPEDRAEELKFIEECLRLAGLNDSWWNVEGFFKLKGKS